MIDPSNSPSAETPAPSMDTLTSIKVCPYLGLKYDPGTHSLTAEVANYCHHCAPPRRVPPNQLKLCFEGGSTTCSFPLSKPPRRRLSLGKLLRRFALPAGGLAILSGAAAVLLGGAPRADQPLPPHAPAPAVQSALMVPTDSTTPFTPLPTFTAAQPTPTFTLLPTEPPTPGPLAGTPFGPGRKLIVHVVLEGETLESLAARHNTSVDVLLTLNPREGRASLWTGEPLVIAEGLSDPSLVTPLRAHWVGEAQPLADLARSLGVSEAKLREWNDIEGDWVEGTRWVVGE